jgi:hypothetical protein
MSEIWKNLLADMEQSKAEPIQQPQQIIDTTPLPTLVLVTPEPVEEEETEDNDDAEAAELGIVDPPSLNNFNLNLPGLSITVPTTKSLEPRIQGRPPQINTAATVLQDLSVAVNKQELSKSSTNTKQTLSQTNKQGKDYTVTISKKTILEIGQSLERIARAIIEITQE